MGSGIGIGNKLLLILMDGKEHRLGDFFDFLTEEIDPTLAVRTYQGDSFRKRRKQEKGIAPRASLERQINLGLWRKAQQTISYYRKKGIIEITYSDPTYERGRTELNADAILQLTPEGYDFLRTSKHVFGEMLNWIRKEFEEGNVRILWEYVDYNPLGSPSPPLEATNGTVLAGVGEFPSLETD